MNTNKHPLPSLTVGARTGLLVLNLGWEGYETDCSMPLLSDADLQAILLDDAGNPRYPTAQFLILAGQRQLQTVDLARYPGLLALDLGYTLLSPHAVAATLAQLPALEILYICLLGRTPELTPDPEHPFNHVDVSRNPKLRLLDVSNSDFSQKALDAALGATPGLEELDVRFCHAIKTLNWPKGVMTQAFLEHPAHAC